MCVLKYYSDNIIILYLIIYNSAIALMQYYYVM